jgi:hypothetical protein
MFAKRKSYNPKRRFAEAPDPVKLEHLANRVHYGGNAEHKRRPGDFGLTPPASPRPDKALCDPVGIFRRVDALELLRTGIRKGLVSHQCRGDFPQNVWAVTASGFPVEAQLENPGNGTYHGYPMPEDDAFREMVIRWWNA